MKISKHEYTAEFKELAVKRVKACQSAGAVAKDLGRIERTLRNWGKAAAYRHAVCCAIQIVAASMQAGRRGVPPHLQFGKIVWPWRAV